MTHEPLGDSGAARWRLPALALLCLLLIAATVCLALRAWDARDTKAPVGGSYGTASERADIVSTTEQFVLRTGTYGPKDLDANKKLTDYRKKVGELLTTKFRTSFEQIATAPEQLVANNKISRVAKVQGVGVASVEGGQRATALIVWDETTSVAGAKYGDPVQARWKVTLLKVKGTWLIDNFETITGEAK
jgi:Mce-associated membrane protein